MDNKMHPGNPQADRPRARSVIESLDPYTRAFASTQPPLYRSSSNESPWGPSQNVADAVAEAITQGNRYPTLHADDLLDSLAQHLNLSVEQIAVGDGSLSLLTYLLLAFTNHGDDVIYSWRSYEAYPITIAAAGGVARPIANTHDGRHDLDHMAAAVTERTSAIIVCSPNNPTGATVTHSEIVRFLTMVPPRVVVVIDQAYADFASSHSHADPIRTSELLERYPNVVILHTFSKSYGLAGFRVGYMLGAAALTQNVKAIQPPFPVSRPAIAAALAGLRDQDGRHRTIQAVIAQRSAIAAMIIAAGLPVTESQANFLWLPLAESSDAFARACSAARIAVRCFSGEGVRISLGEPGLPDALRDVLAAYGA
jgi:histidinol-phosphate aminotransferase